MINKQQSLKFIPALAIAISGIVGVAALASRYETEKSNKAKMVKLQYVATGGRCKTNESWVLFRENGFEYLCARTLEGFASPILLDSTNATLTGLRSTKYCFNDSKRQRYINFKLNLDTADCVEQIDESGIIDDFYCRNYMADALDDWIASSENCDSIELVSYFAASCAIGQKQKMSMYLNKMINLGCKTASGEGMAFVLAEIGDKENAVLAKTISKKK